MFCTRGRKSFISTSPRIQQTENMKNVAVAHDSEIQELLGALSETKVHT